MKSLSLPHTLEKGYIFALLLIFVLATVKYGALEYLVKNQESAALVINVSGRQRMLSQRIAFLSHEYMRQAQGDYSKASLISRKNALKDAVDEFEQNHKDLILGNAARGLPVLENAEIFEVYYGKEGDLDKLMMVYIDSARNVIAGDVGHNGKVAALEYIEEIGTEKILTALNQVVSLHEAQAGRDIRLILLMQILFYIFTAVILVLEAIFLFYPMVKKIKVAFAEIRKRERATKSHVFELERFTHITSHNLKEPVQKITNFAQLLEMHQNDDADEMTLEKRKTYTQYILEGGNQMRIMLDGLHRYASISTKALNVRFVNTEEVFSRALKALMQDYDVEGAHMELPESFPEILYDPALFEMLVMNVLDNAFKFSAGKPLDVKINVHNYKAHWVFEVIDHGVGLRPTIMNDVFSMFYKAHSRGEYHGVGVGLALSRKIVETHRGRIWVESELSEWCKLSFTVVKSLSVSSGKVRETD